MRGTVRLRQIKWRVRVDNGFILYRHHFLVLSWGSIHHESGRIVDRLHEIVALIYHSHRRLVHRLIHCLELSVAPLRLLRGRRHHEVVDHGLELGALGQRRVFLWLEEGCELFIHRRLGLVLLRLGPDQIQGAGKDLIRHLII